MQPTEMFEVRFQTYWADVDAAGIVHFPNFFRYVEQAEEELLRTAAVGPQPLVRQLGIWMPRVEAFSKFVKPIRYGAAIRVRLSPRIEGEKAIRYDFEILDDPSGDLFASGYVTVVCVDGERFKAVRVPDEIRRLIENA